MVKKRLWASLRILFSQPSSQKLAVDKTSVSSTSDAQTTGTNQSFSLNQVNNQSLVPSFDQVEHVDHVKEPLEKSLLKFLRKLILPVMGLFTFLIIVLFMAAAKGRHFIGQALEPLWMSDGFDKDTVGEFKDLLPSPFNMRYFPVYVYWGLKDSKLELQGKPADEIQEEFVKHSRMTEEASGFFKSNLKKLIALKNRSFYIKRGRYLAVEDK